MLIIAAYGGVIHTDPYVEYSETEDCGLLKFSNGVTFPLIKKRMMRDYFEVFPDCGVYLTNGWRVGVVVIGMDAHQVVFNVNMDGILFSNIKANKRACVYDGKSYSQKELLRRIMLQEV